jgi:flagellar basal-body rod modification protein FlgD
MASGVSPLGGSSNATNSSNSSSALTSTAPSESVFLNLLVSQIKNQDPLNPTDSTQFVSQLAQFSELEQVIAIRNDTDKLSTPAANSTATPTPTPTPTPTTTTSTPSNPTSAAL